jgi:hypothetical protein
LAFTIWQLKEENEINTKKKEKNEINEIKNDKEISQIEM